ncbi:hypothetical protein KUTeg_015115 [Tegillarca granosa]|uniref:SGNH hydrolase-type esterase domain-containing protein n=1 Tax=Tegillarca granosa TaxID=220873 RepID=A0ABQ9ESU2_TEGGR|nr:hypothetical protein KUTeg_015115 [Tegillarca granosa]
MDGKEGSIKSPGTSPNWPKIILFGDSITQFSFSEDGCWGSLLSNFVQRKCDVINRGFSGYNTRWCKVILPKVFREFNCKDIMMVTIFLGANDSNLSANTHQHVPVSEYKQLLIDMVENLQNYGIAREKIVLIAPPVCDEETWEKDCIANGRHFTKCNKEAGIFAKACVEAAKTCGTNCIDLYSEMMKQENIKELLNDGLHFAPAGSHLLFDLLKPFVIKATQHLKDMFPDWKDIDNENPHEALNHL